MNAAIRFCIYAAIGYGLLTLLVFFLQRRMIYFPDPDRPAPEIVQAVGLQYWPAEGKRYKGFVDRAHPQTARGTLIVFHGNAGAAWHREYYVRALKPLGYRVVLAEYPGYAGRPGTLSEASLVKDAVDTIKEVRKAFEGPIYLLGESMGCGVAAAAAVWEDISTAGLILITPWDSLPDLAQSLYWYLPARFLTRDRFDSVTNLRAYSGPVAVAVAGRDEVIPKRHSMRLYGSLKAPKRLWIFEGAGHNSWPTDPGAAWWGEVMAFVAGDASPSAGQESTALGR